MDPTILQSLVGNLTHGFHGIGDISAFAQGLQLPDDGVFSIASVDGNGVEHIVELHAKQAPLKDMSTELGYHAVFLLSNHVYFGKLEITPDHRVARLHAAHYLSPDPNDKRRLRLLKVGRELHSPSPTISINMAYVIMWQPIHDHGAVVRAIAASN